MSYANFIIKTVSNRLNNPIAGVLKDIRITKILKQSKIDIIYHKFKRSFLK